MNEEEARKILGNQIPQNNNLIWIMGEYHDHINWKILEAVIWRIKTAKREIKIQKGKKSDVKK